MATEQEKEKIHQNYVKLTGLDIKKKETETKKSQELDAKIHNDKIHNNYIKLLNAGYKTRIIKSHDDLKCHDINKDGLQR